MFHYFLPLSSFPINAVCLSFRVERKKRDYMVSVKMIIFINNSLIRIQLIIEIFFSFYFASTFHRYFHLVYHRNIVIVYHFRETNQYFFLSRSISLYSVIISHTSIIYIFFHFLFLHVSTSLTGSIFYTKLYRAIYLGNFTGYEDF